MSDFNHYIVEFEPMIQQHTDCIEWAGPFDNAIEAIDYLIDTYADGMG